MSQLNPSGHIVGPDDIRVGWEVGSEGPTKSARDQFASLKDTHDIFREDGSALVKFDSSLGVFWASPRHPSPEVVALWPSRQDPRIPTGTLPGLPGGPAL